MIKFSLKNSGGRHYTKQLFHEMWSLLQSELRVGEQAPFTLYQDRPNHINFGKAYVDLADPSGYKITQLYLGGDYKHWIALCNCSWFVEAKEAWDKELEAKLFSEGLSAIKDIAKDETHKGRLQAAKILVDKGYASKMDSKPRRGRPSTEEVEGHLKEAVRSERALQEDLERIRSVN